MSSDNSSSDRSQDVVSPPTTSMPPPKRRTSTKAGSKHKPSVKRRTSAKAGAKSGSKRKSTNKAGSKRKSSAKAGSKRKPSTKSGFKTSSRTPVAKLWKEYRVQAAQHVATMTGSARNIEMARLQQVKMLWDAELKRIDKERVRADSHGHDPGPQYVPPDEVEEIYDRYVQVRYACMKAHKNCSDLVQPSQQLL
ncbi:hypothetical protein OAM67_01245 [bacterium]|nr:hypothetical protein [bacterium]